MTQSFHLRPLDAESDLPALTLLMNAAKAERPNRCKTTEQTLREAELKRLPDEIGHDLVAVDTDGRLCGFGQAGRRAYHAPGAFEINVLVIPDHRRCGVGGQIYIALEQWAQSQGAIKLSATVRDDGVAGQTFAEKCGFSRERHTFSSTLDIATFDDSRFAGTVEGLEAEGLRFFSLADVDSPIARRKLYDLNTLLGMDVPGSSPESVRPFEAFTEDVFHGYWFRPEGQLFAAIGDEWVGMCAVGEVSPGVMANMMTGVLPAHRGRGIALALKLHAVAFCRRHEAERMQTENDSTNAAMLAINRKMGYRPNPGVHHLSKPLL